MEMELYIHTWFKKGSWNLKFWCCQQWWRQNLYANWVKSPTSEGVVFTCPFFTLLPSTSTPPIKIPNKQLAVTGSSMAMDFVACHSPTQSCFTERLASCKVRGIQHQLGTNNGISQDDKLSTSRISRACVNGWKMLGFLKSCNSMQLVGLFSP